jgi:hypothetical protein
METAMGNQIPELFGLEICSASLKNFLLIYQKHILCTLGKRLCTHENCTSRLGLQLLSGIVILLLIHFVPLFLIEETVHLLGLASLHFLRERLTLYLSNNIAITNS